MENISINTTYNITIEQPVASVGDRIVASMIDYGLIIIYYLIVLFINAIAFDSEVFLIIMAALPVLFYHLMSEIFMEGQSWGKKVMRIKVVKIDGSEPDISAYLIRWVFRLVDILLFFGGISAIVIILNGKGQRLGDMAANTSVIKLKDEAIQSTIFNNIPEQYEVVFSQVTRLADSDIHTAKEVLDFLAESYRSREAQMMALKAKSAFEAKMGIKSNLNVEQFLKSLILDYNYIHSR